MAKIDQNTIKKGTAILGVVMSTIGNFQDSNLLIIGGALLTIVGIIMIWGII